MIRLQNSCVENFQMKCAARLEINTQHARAHIERTVLLNSGLELKLFINFVNSEL